MVPRVESLKEYQQPRRRLIERLREQGIQDLAVLHAFDLVPRHLFVPPEFRHAAYQDAALPIGFGQSISRPITHALVLQALQLGGSERVLEVGTGSGFQTALLARLAGAVYSVERIPELVRRAREALGRLRVENVRIRAGDGALGWREEAPFDAILVSAHAQEVPETLVEQLASGGRMLVPLGDRREQTLVLVEKDLAGGIRHRPLAEVQFLPLVPLVQRKRRDH